MLKASQTQLRALLDNVSVSLIITKSFKKQLSA